MATAVHKKQTESKYVSCFTDSRADVDITFRDVLLQRPTDHYLVGIDNFSMTNTTLSMIEPMIGTYDAVIRVVKNPGTTNFTHFTAAITTAAALDARFLLQDAGLPAVVQPIGRLYVTDNSFDLSVPSGNPILNMQELMHRLNRLAADVNHYMNSGFCNAGQFETGFNPGTVSFEHLKFDIGTSGNLTIQATNAFWANFSIEVPSVRNQFGIYSTVKQDSITKAFTGLRRFFSVNPQSAVGMYGKILVNRRKKPVPEPKDQLATQTDAQFAQTQVDARAYNSRLQTGADARVEAAQFTYTAGFQAAVADGALVTSVAYTLREFVLNGNVFSSMERRIALEVGCSLPIKNSPMVDHQKESPDFVLGRWIWRTDPRIESNGAGGSRRYQGDMPSCTRYQGPQDRISYHELQAQAKIQTLRIRLFARLRTFDEETETWGMRVISLPTSATDWWHTRIHFISKD